MTWLFSSSEEIAQYPAFLSQSQSLLEFCWVPPPKIPPYSLSISVLQSLESPSEVRDEEKKA
ncbi:hypothetical protein [Nostoc sp. MS1]|uniref:hypothetical protein n=1 Tax=Nostoc sp. MS1 TaxID=2764711 RepID=UPI001CC51CBC|nr:hypothetical protein [Nostoc sp. MS1]